MQLLLATENSGKKRELIALLSDVEIDTKLPSEVIDSRIKFPEESGLTFAENAFIKANFLFQKSKLPTLADDSGLSIVSLGNFPGIRSARWLKGSSADRNKGLLKKMKKIKERSAFFTTVLCLILPSHPVPYYFEGISKGSIALQPQGAQGFGYDSIFIPEGETQTMAELGEVYKNQNSHRAKALKKLAAFLKNNVID